MWVLFLYEEGAFIAISMGARLLYYFNTSKVELCVVYCLRLAAIFEVVHVVLLWVARCDGPVCAQGQRMRAKSEVLRTNDVRAVFSQGRAQRIDMTLAPPAFTKQTTSGEELVYLLVLTDGLYESRKPERGCE